MCAFLSIYVYYWDLVEVPEPTVMSAFGAKADIKIKSRQCPLSGQSRILAYGGLSAFDPKRTLAGRQFVFEVRGLPVSLN
jgi:hypothetical protein